MKAAALLAVAACLCACSHKRRIPPSESAMHWSALKSACVVDIDHVTCQKQAFRSALRGCIETGRTLEHTREKLAACRSMTAIDRAECMGALEKCRHKLDDPWRSPWRWGVVGLAAGMLGGFAAGLSAD